jgi:hypothetical protein
MIKIEFEPPDESVCECCGGTTTALTRFVYSDGNAHAVYYVRFSNAHPEAGASVLVSLGEWGEGSSPKDRVAFPMRMWIKDGKYAFGLMDKDQSPWSDVTFLGKILDRNEALAHPLKAEAFHITDHMDQEDTAVIAFFDQAPQK